MKKLKGFTLIELIIVILILGILGSVVVPKYVDLTSSTLETTGAQILGATKSALAVAVADLGRYPTLDELTQYIQGATVFISPFGGLQTQAGGVTGYIYTYIDTGCTLLSPVGPFETVRCIGEMSLEPPIPGGDWGEACEDPMLCDPNLPPGEGWPEPGELPAWPLFGNAMPITTSADIDPGVQSAMSEAIIAFGREPTIGELPMFINSQESGLGYFEGAEGDPPGVIIPINGTLHIAPTYSDVGCTVPTVGSAGDAATVRCVGPSREWGLFGGEVP